MYILLNKTANVIELRLYNPIKLIFCFLPHIPENNSLKVTQAEKLLLVKALAASCRIQIFSFIVHSARACICKQIIHNSLQPLNNFNHFYILAPDFRPMYFYTSHMNLS